MQNLRHTHIYVQLDHTYDTYILYYVYIYIYIYIYI